MFIESLARLNYFLQVCVQFVSLDATPSAEIDRIYAMGGSVAEWLGAGLRRRRAWFISQPRRCRVTVLGKLFKPIVPLFTKQQNW